MSFFVFKIIVYVGQKGLDFVVAVIGTFLLTTLALTIDFQSIHRVVVFFSTQ